MMIYTPPPQLITDSHDIISFPLAFIFSREMETGSFPDQLKIAKVTPI